MIIDPHSVKGGSRHDCRLDYKNREYSRRLTIVIQIIIREFSESDRSVPDVTQRERKGSLFPIRQIGFQPFYQLHHVAVVFLINQFNELC